MFLKSHHWVDVPHTVYEMRREMRVRESRQTAMFWDRKYLNIETGKYDSDKLKTLHALTWTDVTEPETQFNFIDARHTAIVRDKPDRDYENEKWFTPPDDDFDDECDEDIDEVIMKQDAVAQIASIASKKEIKPEPVIKLVEIKSQPVFVVKPVYPDIFVREDGSPMVCRVMKNCWIPKT